jgi:hypothetical protein
LAACAKFKNLVETKKMHVASKPLISELKTFVALGNSYEAKIGERDDLVMATLLVVRMLHLIQDFDLSIDMELRDSLEKLIEPMPFIAMF